LALITECENLRGFFRSKPVALAPKLKFTN